MPSFRKNHVKNKIFTTRAKKSVFRRWWFWLAILLLLIILTGLYFAFFYSGFQLENIVISGNEKVMTKGLREAVLKNTKTTFLSFAGTEISSSSIFLINGNNIKNDILKTFPVIKNLTINKNFPQTIVIVVNEREPIGAFCPPAVTAQADSGCFLIDNQGVAFEAITGAPLKTTIVRQATGNGQIYLGQTTVSQDIINAIYEIQKNLKDNFQIDLKEALIASPVRLNVTTNGNWQAYFDLNGDSDIGAQLTELGLLLRGGISKSDMRNLKYIDLRPKDRAIICDNSTCGK